MRFLYILIIIGTSLGATQNKYYSANVVPKNMDIQEKKNRFNTILLPIIQKIHKELQQRYLRIKDNIKKHENLQEITALKKKYKVKTDEDLLIALKPHPLSITLAQAAIESSWGTSRFFVEANNIFGVWSTSSKQKRIAARGKRNGKTIWMRKFDSLDDAIRDYYRMLSSSKTYKKFKKMNYEEKSVFEMLEGLKHYSEKKDEYIKTLRSIIRRNNFTKYD